MRIKVHVKSNDNENVEEWWPAEQVLASTTLPATLDSLIRSATMLADLAEAHGNELSAIPGLQSSLTRLTGIVAEHSRKHSADLGLHRLLAGHLNALREENNRLMTRIERLEQIITSMARGCETSQPENGNGHTHWVYPANGASTLIAEMCRQEPELGGAVPHQETTDEALFDAVDDLLYDAETNSYPRGQLNAEYLDALRGVFLSMCEERGGTPSPPNRCPRCNGLMPPGDTPPCVECESELAEIAEEEIREIAWNLCKGYDVGSHRRDKVILTNFVSTKLECIFGSEIENLHRADWLEEVGLFCEKYGYD